MFTNTPYGTCFPQANNQPQYEYYNEEKAVPYENQVILPQPTGLPWNLQEMPWGSQSPPKLVEFTAVQHSREPANTNNAKVIFPQKRKSDLDAAIPNKIVKTDEVMAAHLNGLHISLDFTSHSKPFNNACLDDITDENSTSDQIMERLKEKQSMSIEDRLKCAERIVLCDEMRRLKNESILPRAIMDKLEKPCMSLVLWRPPNRIITSNDSDKNNNPNRSRNSKQSVLVSDSNAMDMDL